MILPRTMTLPLPLPGRAMQKQMRICQGPWGLPMAVKFCLGLQFQNHHVANASKMLSGGPFESKCQYIVQCCQVTYCYQCQYRIANYYSGTIIPINKCTSSKKQRFVNASKWLLFCQGKVHAILAGSKRMPMSI